MMTIDTLTEREDFQLLLTIFDSMGIPEFRTDFPSQKTADNSGLTVRLTHSGIWSGELAAAIENEGDGSGDDVRLAYDDTTKKWTSVQS